MSCAINAKDDFEAEFEMCSASPSKSTEVLKTKLQTMKQSNNGLSACKFLLCIFVNTSYHPPTTYLTYSISVFFGASTFAKDMCLDFHYETCSLLAL